MNEKCIVIFVRVILQFENINIFDYYNWYFLYVPFYDKRIGLASAVYNQSVKDDGHFLFI